MNALEWLDDVLGKPGELLKVVPIPFRCRCGRPVVLEGPPPPELVFDRFDAQNIARLVIHMSCHHGRALDAWQNEGGA